MSKVSSTGGPLRTATPAKLPPWFEPYTRWRMIGLRFAGAKRMFPRPPKPRHITVSEYGWVLDEWDRYLLWEAWLDSGRKGARPVGLWLSPTAKPVSPGWAGRTWRLVKQYRKAPPKPPAPVPPAPPKYDVSLGYSWVFMAQEPQKALMYPAYYGILFTANVPPYEAPSPSLVEQLKQQGRRLGTWCDCHGTFPSQAKQLSSDWGLGGFWCGEGESAGAFQVAVDAGAELVVINLSALTPDQKERYLRPRKTCVINELYLNQDASRADRENWEGLPIAGRVVAMYDAASEASTGQRLPFSYYTDRGLFVPRHDSVYDPGATDQDRQAVT
jgi:hypothetical protein